MDLMEVEAWEEQKGKSVIGSRTLGGGRGGDSLCLKARGARHEGEGSAEVEVEEEEEEHRRDEGEEAQ